MIGALTGTSLHYASNFMISTLRLNTQPKQSPNGDLALQRPGLESFEHDQEMESLGGAHHDKARLSSGVILSDELKDWDWARKDGGRSGRGLIPNTILEEEDSSDDGL